MTALIVIILFIILWPRIWRWLSPYLARWAQRRTEDYLRRSMGMPPRDKSRGKKSDKESSRQQSSGGSGFSFRSRRKASEPLIPKEYAEDVSFTEIRSYSEDTRMESDGEGVRFRTESQVSDAEILEIKKDSTSRH